MSLTKALLNDQDTSDNTKRC